MNLFNLTGTLVFATLLLSGCGDKTDQTLSPPENARRISVTFRVPEGTQILPAQLLYRSDKCRDKSYDSSMKSYEVRGYNGFKQNFTQQGNSNIWQARFAIDGGGSCQWQLNSLKVSFKIADGNPLIMGKKMFDTNYIFDFDKYGFSDGYSTGHAKQHNGDLNLKTDFFPMLTWLDKNEALLRLFSGDVELKKWSRRYSLHNTQYISLEPKVHFDKVVTLTPPQKNDDFTATYPDGSSEEIPDIYPDYEKLLSMK